MNEQQSYEDGGFSSWYKFFVPCRGVEALQMNNKPMKMEDLVYDDQIYQRLQQQEEGLETVLKMEVFDEDQILPPG